MEAQGQEMLHKEHEPIYVAVDLESVVEIGQFALFIQVYAYIQQSAWRNFFEVLVERYDECHQDNEHSGQVVHPYGVHDAYDHEIVDLHGVQIHLFVDDIHEF